MVAAGVTVIAAVVAPVLHNIVPVQVAVNVTGSLPQRLSLLAVIAGVIPAPPFVMVTVFEAPLSPQVFIQVAV